jgi:hypothetical protein
MVYGFAFRLNRRMVQLSLPHNIVRGLQENEIKLAGLHVPAGLDPGAEAAVKESIGQAFVFAFRIVMLICGILSSAGAAIAWFMIHGA